jgi:hypothetical protein
VSARWLARVALRAPAGARTAAARAVAGLLRPAALVLDVGAQAVVDLLEAGVRIHRGVLVLDLRAEAEPFLAVALVRDRDPELLRHVAQVEEAPQQPLHQQLVKWANGWNA